jgi:O-antigen ligase
MLGWVVLAFASIAMAMRPDMALAGAVDLAKWALIFLLIVNLVTTYGRWQWFVWTFLLLNLKLSQFQLRAYSYGLQQATNKDFFITQGAGAGSTSFLGNATDFGAAMCVVVPFAVYMMRCARWKPLRILGLIAAVFFVLSIVRTGSRGAAVALFAMAAAYWWKSRHKAPVALAVVGLAIAVWVITPQASRERFISATDYQEDATASSRLDFWEAGLKMFVKHPLTGVGMHNFAYNYQAGGGIKIVPHSIFIQAASELGVPGITILFALLYIIFKRNRESRRLAAEQGRTDLRAFADALDLSLVGFIVSGAFLTILYYPHIFMILAMTISLNQIVKKNAPVHAEIENVTAPRRTDRESV